VLSGTEMIEILIVADDLSGAADCAVACAAAGAETVVMMGAERKPEHAGVVAIDINSRTLAPDVAGRAAAQAIETSYSPETRILYQKMDSTLRGNWPAELTHIREASARLRGALPLAIVAPAFPEHGRTTLGGRALVNGKPLADTEIWAHERLTGKADLRSFLHHCGLGTALAPIEQVRRGADELHGLLAGCVHEGIDAVVCDAENGSDLATIATASLALGDPMLWVGSAGLMRSLIAASKPRSLGPAPVSIAVTGSMLVVVGSASRASRDQFEFLAAQPAIAALTLAPNVVRQGTDTVEARAFREAGDAALAAGKDLAVAIAWGSEIDLREGASLAAGLADLTAPFLPVIAGMVMTGGETARAVMLKAGIAGLRMQGEVEPGVPIGTAIGDTAIPVITKAGAFGDRETLRRCRAALRGAIVPRC
jgi:uncharacterized protein YgbK (DUF1537 family)